MTRAFSLVRESPIFAGYFYRMSNYAHTPVFFFIEFEFESRRESLIENRGVFFF